MEAFFAAKQSGSGAEIFVLRSIMPVIWMDSFLYYAMASSTEEFHLKSAIFKPESGLNQTAMSFIRRE